MEVAKAEPVFICEVHIAAGDDVAVDEPLITLETDKAAMDVPAVVAGKIEAVLLKVGDTVSEGSPIAVIDAIASAVEPIEETAKKAAPAHAKPPPAPKPAEAPAPPAGPPQA